MYFKQKINQILLSERIHSLEKKKEKYSIYHENEDLIYEYQLNEFNKTWSYALQNIRFYSEYAKKNSLPSKINSIKDLKKFPVIRKDDLYNFLSIKENKIYLKNHIKTGGSSGKPISFPFDLNDQKSSYLRSYIGRSRIGIYPFDSTALIWGHSHLFEKNFKGRFKHFVRKLKDLQLNTHRLSAYDLSDESIDSYIKIIKSRNIKFLIGYTSCVTKLAQRLIENDDEHNFDNLKSIVVTAENVDKADINLIEKAFNTKCDIEYGMAEAGVLGYSNDNTKKISFFWDDFIYQKNDNNSLIITSIYDRFFPLIRYDTGDIINTINSQDSLLYVDKIVGRSNDNLQIVVNKKLITVHSELFTHILKSIDDVKDFLIIQRNQNIEIQIESDTQDIRKLFFSKLDKEYKNVNKDFFNFVYKRNIQKTITTSGKKRWIIIEK